MYFLMSGLKGLKSMGKGCFLLHHNILVPEQKTHASRGLQRSTNEEAVMLTETRRYLLNGLVESSHPTPNIWDTENHQWNDALVPVSPDKGDQTA